MVPQLLQAGGKVRVLSRHPGAAAEGIEFAVGDLDTGRGIDAAVAGAEVIVHCAGSQKGDGDKTRTLVRAGTARTWLPDRSAAAPGKSSWPSGSGASSPVRRGRR